MGRFKIPVLFVCLAFSVWVNADDIDPFVMPSARYSGLGGSHAAMADDFYSIFLNPAAFVGIEEQFSASEITINTYGPVFELINLIRQYSNTSDLDISSIVGPGGFAAGFDLGGPLAIGWVGRGLGLGIYSRIRTSAAVSGYNIRPIVSGEVLFTGGYGFRVVEKGAHHLDLGFLGKGFFRGVLNLESSIFEVDKLLDGINSQPIGSYLGMGVDLGIKYTVSDNFSAAIVCYDAYSPVLVIKHDSLTDFAEKESGASSYATVQRRLDLGLSYRIRTDFVDRYFSRLTVMADYHNFLDLLSLIPRNPVLNVSLGVELILLNALSLRFGIADALPAFGVGLDLTFMKIDFSIYGKEIGLDPGVMPVYALAFGFLFRY